jgi:hypothetical protein
MRKMNQLNCEALEARDVPSVTFKFDYSQDTKGFFSDTTRRSALEAAGKMLSSRLDDSLTAITPSGTNTWSASFPNPATGSTTTKSNMSVPANTLVVFVGGRDLASGTLAIGGGGGYSASGSSTWLNTVKGRGQSGALSSTPTDTAIWGGALTFDTVGTNWHFGATTSGLDSNESDFRSVAMHELGHMLGVGGKVWSSLVSNGNFIGANAKAAYNNRVVPVNGGRDHFAEGIKSNGLEVAMDPSLTQGTRKFFSKLDFAALKDIGWQVSTGNGTINLASHLLTGSQGGSGLGGSDATVFGGSIDSAKDVDFYRVYLYAGNKLSVSTSGYNSNKVDTYLKLFDASGTVLKTADQGGVGGKDTLDFTVTRSDYYYIAVSSYANRSYDPMTLNSGPGGTTGDYSFGIQIDW